MERGQNFRPPTVVLTIQEGRNLSDGGVKKSADAYCIVKLGKYSQKTRTVKGQRNPTFNQQFTIPVSGSDDVLEVEVWDWDRLTSDDRLGNIKIHLRSLEDWKEHDLWYPVTKHKGPASTQPETLGSREATGRSGYMRLKLRYYDEKREWEESERRRIDEARRRREQTENEKKREQTAMRMRQKKNETLTRRDGNNKAPTGLSQGTRNLADIMMYFCIAQMLFAFLIALNRADMTCVIALFGIYGASERHFESVLMYLLFLVFSVAIDLCWIIIEAQYLSLLSDAEYARMSSAESSLTGTKMFALVASCIQLAAKFLIFVYVAYLLYSLQASKKRSSRSSKPLNAAAMLDYNSAPEYPSQYGAAQSQYSQYGGAQSQYSQYGGR